MCGIVGYVGEREDAIPILIEGLKRLEYRGYDSAGVAVVENGEIRRQRAEGKIARLEEVLAGETIGGPIGVGHTRWATHGRPSEENAHPHTDCTGRIVVVHNGIIENYLELKEALAAEGHRFVTETDTEVIAHLVEKHRKNGVLDAVRVAAGELRGAFALAVLSADEPDRIVATKTGPPLVVGVAEGKHLVASDIPALLPQTRDVFHLEDGEVAELTAGGARIWNESGEEVERAPERVQWDPVQAEKGSYKHFMHKEIHEQPLAVRDTIMGRFSIDEGQVFLPDLQISEKEAAAIRRVTFIACGTSWHAAMAGQYMVEGLAGLPASVDIASEYRYRQPPLDDGELIVAISQSGETADTLAALKELRAKGGRTIAVTNVPGSRIVRDTDGMLLTLAGPEIGVAATKTFTTQLAALYLFSLWLARARGALDEEAARGMLKRLAHLPPDIERALELEPQCEEIARALCKKEHFLYLGRGIHYPVALEGALKLKEISYIHAEGYAAGEMKHGPIALITAEMPVVAVCPHDDVYEKMLGNLQEVRARDGIVVAVTDQESNSAGALADHVLVLPRTDPLLQPIVETVPLQLLAYHVALRRGCDVDQPRNLAKSVTVE